MIFRADEILFAAHFFAPFIRVYLRANDIFRENEHFTKRIDDLTQLVSGFFAPNENHPRNARLDKNDAAESRRVITISNNELPEGAAKQ